MSVPCSALQYGAVLVSVGSLHIESSLPSPRFSLGKTFPLEMNSLPNRLTCWRFCVNILLGSGAAIYEPACEVIGRVE